MFFGGMASRSTGMRRFCGDGKQVNWDGMFFGGMATGQLGCDVFCGDGNRSTGICLFFLRGGGMANRSTGM